MLLEIEVQERVYTEQKCRLIERCETLTGQYKLLTEQKTYLAEQKSPL